MQGSEGDECFSLRLKRSLARPAALQMKMLLCPTPVIVRGASGLLLSRPGLKPSPFWRGLGPEVALLVMAGSFEGIGRSEGVLGEVKGIFIGLAAGQKDQEDLPRLVVA